MIVIRCGLVLLLLLLGFLLLGEANAQPAMLPDFSNADDLLNEVNQLRAEHGLYGYTQSSVLMGIAQSQADYLAAIGVSNTHIDAFGRRPFQRALDAGYPVVGDLSLGGYFSENVVGGVGLTAEGAVEIWMGDAPHQNTMLSTILRDAGAGVTAVGNTYFYVLDVGLSTGGTPVAYTPPPYVIRDTPTHVTSTPNPDGTIYHIVQPGETLGSISVAYDIPLADLLALNRMSITSIIYTDQKILIRGANTATPTEPTATATLRPSSTAWPTSTREVEKDTPSATSPAPAILPTNSTLGAVAAIIIAAIVAAAILTFINPNQRKNDRSPD